MDRHTWLSGQLRAARAQTDGLFGLLAPGQLYVRPIAERHRLVFYLGHLEAFDRNLLARHLGIDRPLHVSWDELFARGIDPPVGKAAADRVSDWPGEPEVRAYVAAAREWVEGHLRAIEPDVLQMALEHRLMHAETLAYLLHGLPPEAKFPGKPPSPGGEAPPNPWVTVRASRVRMGAPEGAFGWDNEHPGHDLDLPPFQIKHHKLTHAEYLAFVADGGPVPPFWQRSGDHWHLRTFFGRVPLPLDHPVWVTWDQAAAYAEWQGNQLPTEAQWLAASQMSTSEPDRDNYDFRSFDTCPVPSPKVSQPPPRQLTGNGWEWTRDVFRPFAGFQAHPLYPGYSADFFDDQHRILKGAGPWTSRVLARPAFRNWFRPDYPHVHAGFRLVKD
ncbi:MAG: SUMF1/EgtB/PvdO family nonheme iron enzyme [Candidatus Sericytochromatia bacterium]|nr:SUMF1/EgtB/PvdO family nonheme iron enzyme [Candidatus Sericytochromatia bacterium]